MNAAVVLPAITTALAAIFSLALLDQWRRRRRAYQLVWADRDGVLRASPIAAEAIAAAVGLVASRSIAPGT